MQVADDCGAVLGVLLVCCALIVGRIRQSANGLSELSQAERFVGRWRHRPGERPGLFFGRLLGGGFQFGKGAGLERAGRKLGDPGGCSGRVADGPLAYD